jgi:hypothetical protein
MDDATLRSSMSRLEPAARDDLRRLLIRDLPDLVGSSSRSIRSHRSHSFRKASCMSSAASARFPVTKNRALNSPACSSAKNAAKSGGACSAAGNRMTSPSACITLLDAADAMSA